MSQLYNHLTGGAAPRCHRLAVRDRDTCRATGTQVQTRRHYSSAPLVRHSAALLMIGMVSVLLGACKGVDTRVHWYFERMIRQNKYMPFEAAPIFPDSRAMRVPPGGTIPRGVVIETAVITEGIAEGPEIVPGLDEVSPTFPFPLTDDVLDRGRKHFEITCAACHGAAGDAVSIVATKMQIRPPPSLHQAALKAYTPGQLFQVITEGYGLMPSYVTLLDWEERWAVVAYVKALQLSRSAAVGALPEPVQGAVRDELTGLAR